MVVIGFRKMEEQNKSQEALNKYFEDSDEVTAQHVLYNDFVKSYGQRILKFQMYILFQDGWGNCTGKAKCGSLGYHKKLKVPQPITPNNK